MTNRKPLQAMGSHRSVGWNPPEGDSWKPYDLTEYLEETGDHGELVEAPSTDLLVRTDGMGLLYPGRTHGLFAPSGAGKSWCALLPVRDVLLAGGRGLFLDYEDVGPREVMDRLRRLGVPIDMIVAGLIYVRPQGLPIGQQWEQLVYRPYGVAVIDSATGALAEMERDGNSNSDVTVWAKSTVHPLAEGGTPVVVVDHTPHAGNRIIGAAAKKNVLTGASYRVVAIKPLTPGKIGVVDLHVVKDRAGYVYAASGTRRKDDSAHAARITFDATDPNVIDVSIDPPAKTAEAAPGPDSDQQVQVLRERLSREVEQSATPLTQNTLARAVGGDRNDAVAQLRHLVADGYLATERGRRNALLHRSVRPYRADEA